MKKVLTRWLRHDRNGPNVCAREAAMALLRQMFGDSVNRMKPPGAGRFVIKSGLRESVEDTSEVERLSDDVVVIPAPGGRATKETWQQMVNEHGEAAWIQPVITDDLGHERFPTGELTVRFDKRPSDEEVQAFARDRGLRVERRNTYQPEQVVLVPERPRDVYLPELCEELEREPEVARAWLNTLSRYTRE